MNLKVLTPLETVQQLIVDQTNSNSRISVYNEYLMVCRKDLSASVVALQKIDEKFQANKRAMRENDRMILFLQTKEKELIEKENSAVE